MSSNKPTQNSIMPPAIKAIQCSMLRLPHNFSYNPSLISTTTMMVIVTIIIGKNIMPPRRGMGNLCIFLSSSGRSYNFRAWATFTTLGVTNRVNIREMAKANSNITVMSFIQ